MYALAIETSGRIGSVALVRAGEVIAEQSFEHGLRHAAEILPIIDRLTRDHRLTPADISELYVSAGPGSFTGLRIGITLAKTLALATGVKLVAVPTLAVLAENAPAEARELIVVLDAKREQIFTARFHRGESGRWEEAEPAHLDSLAAMIERSPKPVHLLGEGIPHHRKYIPPGPNVIVVEEPAWRARAGAVARLGYIKARAGDFADPDRLAPTYVRKPEAEEKWEAANPGSV